MDEKHVANAASTTTEIQPRQLLNEYHRAPLLAPQCLTCGERNLNRTEEKPPVVHPPSPNPVYLPAPVNNPPIPVPVPDWIKAAVNEFYFGDQEGGVTLAEVMAQHWSRATQQLTCAYCARPYPPGTPESQHSQLTAHIKVCPSHPLRAAEARIAELETEVVALESSLPWISNRTENDAGAALGRVYRLALPDGLPGAEIGVVEVNCAREALAKAYADVAACGREISRRGTKLAAIQTILDNGYHYGEAARTQIRQIERVMDEKVIPLVEEESPKAAPSGQLPT